MDILYNFAIVSAPRRDHASRHQRWALPPDRIFSLLTPTANLDSQSEGYESRFVNQAIANHGSWIKGRITKFGVFH